MAELPTPKVRVQFTIGEISIDFYHLSSVTKKKSWIVGVEWGLRWGEWEMGSLDVESSSNHRRLIHLRRLWVGHSYGMSTVEGFPNESSAEKE